MAHSVWPPTEICITAFFLGRHQNKAREATVSPPHGRSVNPLLLLHHPPQSIIVQMSEGGLVGADTFLFHIFYLVWWECSNEGFKPHGMMVGLPLGSDHWRYIGGGYYCEGRSCTGHHSEERRRRNLRWLMPLPFQR